MRWFHTPPPGCGASDWSRAPSRDRSRAYDPILCAVFNWEVWRVDRDAHFTQNFARFGSSAPHRIAPLTIEPYRLYGYCITLALYQERQTTRHGLTPEEGDTWGKSGSPNTNATLKKGPQGQRGSTPKVSPERGPK